MSLESEMDPFRFFEFYNLVCKYMGNCPDERRVRNKAESLMFDLDDLSKDRVVPSITLNKIDFPYYFIYSIPRSEVAKAKMICRKYDFLAY